MCVSLSQDKVALNAAGLVRLVKAWILLLLLQPLQVLLLLPGQVGQSLDTTTTTATTITITGSGLSKLG